MHEFLNVVFMGNCLGVFFSVGIEIDAMESAEGKYNTPLLYL